MPPKVKVTKEDIIQTAFDLVREGGKEALNARGIAKAMGCSTQPIFSNFSGMEEIDLSVTEKAIDLCQKYIDREIESAQYPVYKASGMAYIRFAKEEKELFKMLYMCERSETDDAQNDLFSKMTDVVRENTGLKEEDSTLFHLEMWALVHGIATMFATGFLDLSWDLVSRMLTDIYLGQRKQFGAE